LARAIVGLARANAEGIIHACNAGACSWYEFAREVVRTAGLAQVTVGAARTEDMPPRPARRPKYSVLSTASLERYGLHMRSWRETLSDYFADRLKIPAVRQQAVI
jgi:dTDP-4-dehydrorhamnose reductase